VTGRDGGRDIDLRQRAREGMELYGRLLEVAGDDLVLAGVCLSRPGRRIRALTSRNDDAQNSSVASIMAANRFRSSE